MIPFRLAECINVDGVDQEQMDQAEVIDILNSISYHENINLADKVVRNGIKRLGRKDGPGIRPIRVVLRPRKIGTMLSGTLGCLNMMKNIETEFP